MKADKEAAQVCQPEPLGEVVSSSITGFVATVRTAQTGVPLAIGPGFGTFVRVESPEQMMTIVAVVYNLITGAADSSHTPTALGMSRQQLAVEQPHIFSLLRTELHAVNIGYFQHGKYFSHLPPHPAQVHDFVYSCTAQEVQTATEEVDFLRLIAGVTTVPSDELLASAIRESSLVHTEQFLITAGQALAQLFREDYDRLLAVLKKVKPH